jgi:hypothetical protein
MRVAVLREIQRLDAIIDGSKFLFESILIKKHGKKRRKNDSEQHRI